MQNWYFNCVFQWSVLSEMTKTNVFLKSKWLIWGFSGIMIYGDKNKFLNLVSDSVRLHNQIYGVHRIKFPSFYPGLVFVRIVVQINLLHRHQSRCRWFFLGCFFLGWFRNSVWSAKTNITVPSFFSPFWLILSSSILFVSSASNGLLQWVTFVSMSTCTDIPSDLWKNSMSVSSSSESTFRAFGFDSEIFPSSASVFVPSHSRTFRCFCLFGDLWNLTCVGVIFRCKVFLFAVRTICSVPSMAISSFSLFFTCIVFSGFILKKCVRILQISTYWLYRSSLWWLLWRKISLAFIRPLATDVSWTPKNSFWWNQRAKKFSFIVLTIS